MRHYEENIASAAGPNVALAMVVDGALAPSELRALSRSRLLGHIDIDLDTFHSLLEDLCNDLLTTSVKHVHVELAPTTIDSLLGRHRRGAAVGAQV